MAVRILPGANDARTICCPCTPDPCNCNNPPCNLQCRSVSSAGSGSFCGFAEFGTPSSPPKYYHTKNFAGGFSGEVGTDDRGCGYLTSCNWSSAISGQNLVDPITCVTTKGSTVTGTGAGGCITCNGFTSGFDDITLTAPFVCFYFGGITQQTSSTEISYTIDNVCFTNPSGFVGSLITSAQATEGLADQDSASEAIARSIGGAPVYGPAGDCSPSNASSTTLVQDAHGPHFTYGATLAQVRAQLQHLQVGQNYTVQIVIGSRPVGSSAPFTTYTTFGVQFEATDPNENTEWFQMPNINGLTFMPISCSVEVTGG